MKKASIFLCTLLLAACGGSGGDSASDATPANESTSAQPEFSVSESGVKTKNVEGFGGGRDTGTQVSDLYTGIFQFTGELDRVIFTISDENTVPPRELPAMYY